MNILIDGSTLSLLLYAHNSDNANQMGFLLGHKSEDVQDRISDSQIHTEDTKCYIYISSFIPWPNLRGLHGCTGCLNPKEICKACEGYSEEIIGWYSFRHQSSLRPSMKEAAIHHKLLLMEEFNKSQDFLFFLCTSSVTSNLSTHSSDHAFMTYDSCTRKFKNVSTGIRNLGDTSRSEYQKASMTFVIHSHQTQGVVDKSIKGFVNPSGEIDQVVKMKKFAESIGKSLNTLQMQVNKSEASLGLLEDEVRYLRKRMAHLETKDMTSTFKKEQQRLKEEEQDNLQSERVSESNEEEQMNKLLTDLGLSADIASTLFHKPEERTRKMSQDQDNFISWEKMEVNPLYASTLNSNQASSLHPAQTINIHSPSQSKESSVCDASTSETHVAKEIDSAGKRNLEIRKDKEGMPNSSHSKPPAKDHFDFVEQYKKSELNGYKGPSLTKTSESQGHSNVPVSNKPSAMQLPVSSDNDSESEQHQSDTHLSRDNLNASNAAKSNASQLSVNESMTTQEFPSKLSSSPVF